MIGLCTILEPFEVKDTSSSAGQAIGLAGFAAGAGMAALNAAVSAVVTGSSNPMKYFKRAWENYYKVGDAVCSSL